MAKKRWKCSVCKQPIDLEAGRVELFDNSQGKGKPGGYPQIATPPFEPPKSKDGFIEMADAAKELLDQISKGFNVGIRVAHLKCLGEDDGSYGFTAPATLESWLAWAFHLEEKTWMGREDLMHFIRFWWTGHGEETPDI
jgi:hypothetical protein